MGRQVEEQVGSGIARRSKRSRLLEGSELDAHEFIEWMRSSAAARRRPWGYHADIIAVVKLEYAGLTESLRALPIESAEHSAAFDAHNQLYRERDTEQWYVREIAKLSTIVEMCVEGNRPWEAVTQSILIGELLTEARLKFKWDKDATFGRDTRRNLAEGQANRRRSKKDERFNDVERLLEAGKTLSNACTILASRHKVRPETLEKDYQRIKKERTPARVL